MVAVAIVGATLFAWREYSIAVTTRRPIYLEKFHHHALMEWVRSQVEPNPRKLEFHRSMRRKYERACDYPWLPVASDPPEPE
jgi:hypothetical protein